MTRRITCSSSGHSPWQVSPYVSCLILLLTSGVAIPSCFADCGKITQPIQNSALAQSPASIQKLAKDIRGKNRDEVAAAIIHEFGPAARDVGSGVSIQQWDVGSGVLTYSLGLVSFRTNNGKQVWVTATVNKALPTLTAESFEMHTHPEHGMKYWLGNLYLKHDLTYAFVDSADNLEHRSGQTQNFFVKYPAGRYEIHFAQGCTADTILEQLPDATFLARLSFLPRDGGPEVDYDIVAYASDRRLAFHSKQPLVFLMNKYWWGIGN